MKSPHFLKKMKPLNAIGLIVAAGLIMLTGSQYAPASCINLSDIPLEAIEQPAPGMIMFVFDDSGSMDWSIMCPPGEETDGVFNGNYYVFPDVDNIDNEYWYHCLENDPGDRMMWMSQWAGYNGLYYDPANDYTPWPKQGNADPDHPLSDPMDDPADIDNTLDMTAMWHTWGVPGASDIARRHYYVQSGEDGNIYLVNLLGSSTIEYYRVNVEIPFNKREVITLAKMTAVATPPADITVVSYADACQNFANWYSYYRRRELTAKNAIANVIDSSDGIYIGLLYINNYRSRDQRVLPVRVNLDGTLYDDSAVLLNNLYGYKIGQYGTPLRVGLKKAGRFFEGDYLNPGTDTAQYSSDSYPFFKATEGGSCQQAFTIIFSDGYYNGTTSPGVGNADGDHNTAFDGDPFGDLVGDTLADVAMNYFETDLKDDLVLPDDVTVSTIDPAPHQHMVTYTIAFGVTGSLDTDLYKTCALPGGNCPESWPAVSGSSGKIDDMFHAAINGRGKYLSAKSTTELNAALKDLKNDIDSRLGAAAALATNSVQLSVGSVIYQGTYSTANWFGEVRALPLDVQNGVVGSPIWLASEHLPAWTARKILSSSGSAGIVFNSGNLTATQVSQLEVGGVGSAADIVDFIRGDVSKSVDKPGGTLRNRSHLLGDIVHSAPTYFKGAVYVGANDGMLHAVDAASGQELFAYVPNLVYDHLADLAAPNYSHKYYVDNTPTVAQVNSQDLLVGGLGKGGKGYFALDVTNPAAMGAGDVLWEFPPAADPDMGYSFSRAIIVQTKAEGPVVIFGNGYDSVNGSAVLYVLRASDGSVLKKLDTTVTGCNGLSTPSAVDVELDGYVDFVFAGDLKGNLWKFDLRGAGIGDWEFFYQNGATPMPLITVKNPSGQIQPITSSPEVMLDCVLLPQGRGLMVIFGTGQYLNAGDFNDATVQSLYGVWDWGAVWEAEDGYAVAKTKSLGTFNGDRSLSNMASGITLLEQSFILKDSAWGVLTDFQPDWVNPFVGSGIGTHMGWLIDLPEAGERSILKPVLNAGAAILITTIPASSPCTAGGTSGTYTVSACTGGHYKKPVYDVNGDGLIDENDKIIVTGVPEPQAPQWHPDPKILWDLLIISGEAYQQDAEGNLDHLKGLENQPGMFYWRVLGL